MKKRIGGFLLLLALMTWFACQGSKTQDSQQAAVNNQQQSAEQQQTPSAEQSHQQSAAPPLTAGFRMPPFWENPDAAPMLTPTLDPTTVSAPAQAAYLIAQRKPKLLAQMPCFCYCDRFGHKSLHDCYVSTHAEHCDVCMAEAIEADQMDQQGMSAQEIRSVIVAKHHPPSE